MYAILDFRPCACKADIAMPTPSTPARAFYGLVALIFAVSFPATFLAPPLSAFQLWSLTLTFTAILFLVPLPASAIFSLRAPLQRQPTQTLHDSRT